MRHPTWPTRVILEPQPSLHLIIARHPTQMAVNMVQQTFRDHSKDLFFIMLQWEIALNFFVFCFRMVQQ